METVLITGGTGMIGRQLTKLLCKKGYRVIILTRKMPGAKTKDAKLTYALWNVEKRTIDVSALQQADYIVHLAGAGVVDKKWTEAYKTEIVQSRTESSALLIETLQNNPNKVKVFVSASAIGWYGEDPAPAPGGFIESDAAATGFLGETCKLWEASVAPVEKLDIRLVKVRTGIVLSNEGGALPEFKMPLKFGIAGILSKGRQVVSWIHIDDLCRIFIEAITNGEMHGSYNAVAPYPVTNKQLTVELASQLKGKFYISLHVPAMVLKLMLGSRSMEVLKSTTVSCGKIRLAGFTFLYPSIQAALAELCSV